MELKRETICENTLEFVQEYYHLNTEPLFSILADDCVWMGTGNVLASGAAAIRGFFKDGFIMPPYHLAEPDFRLGNRVRGAANRPWTVRPLLRWGRAAYQRSQTAVYVLLPGGKRPGTNYIFDLTYAAAI